ncbi:MAG: Uma2 family endonuclease [Candidatus Sumerlaeota bacterium]|nr:Uma2 family endonuclease [Candidatus Sumerlaeota bacterium]
MTVELATQQNTMTAEEFWTLASKDEFRGELVHGKVVEMVPPCVEHGVIAGNLIEALGGFVKARQLGKVMAEVGFILSRDPDSVRAPDVSFIRAERLVVTKRFSEVPPDLAVEIISPSDTYSGVLEKARMYLNAGVQEVWIIDPDAKSIEVRRTLHEAKVYQREETVETPLLPGLSLPVASLFE